MNQLEYQTAFHPGPFAQPQAFAATPYSGQQDAPQNIAVSDTQHQQHLQQPQRYQPQPQSQHHHQRLQQQPTPRQQHTHDASFHTSPAQPAGPYTSALPFSHPVSATASPAQAAHQPTLRQSASPHQSNSPYAGAPQQQQQQQQQQQLQHQQQSYYPQQPAQRYPMAAPPLPQTPAKPQSSAAKAAPTPPTPHSTEPQGIEQSRIKLLFDINMELFQEISNLQAQGRGGATSPQHQAQLSKLGLDEKMATEEYIQTMRRVQANLSYLAPRGNVNSMGPKPPPGPAHMTPPQQMPHLQSRYDRLKEVFPGWIAQDMLPQSSSDSP